jgi:hypothetical protein
VLTIFTLKGKKSGFNRCLRANFSLEMKTGYAPVPLLTDTRSPQQGSSIQEAADLFLQFGRQYLQHLDN